MNLVQCDSDHDLLNTTHKASMEMSLEHTAMNIKP